jgi:hypothetical protein
MIIAVSVFKLVLAKISLLLMDLQEVEKVWLPLLFRRYPTPSFGDLIQSMNTFLFYLTERKLVLMLHLLY